MTTHRFTGHIASADAPVPPENSLPLHLVEGLARHGVPDLEISALSEEETTGRLHGLWNSGVCGQ